MNIRKHKNSMVQVCPQEERPMILGIYVVNAKPRNKQNLDLSNFFGATEKLLKSRFHCIIISTLNSEEKNVFLRLVIQENEQISQKVGKLGIFH